LPVKIFGTADQLGKFVGEVKRVSLLWLPLWVWSERHKKALNYNMKNAQGMYLKSEKMKPQ